MVNFVVYFNIIHLMRKPEFCICENKGPDQLRTSLAADQGRCFYCFDSIIPLICKSEI